MTPPVDAEITSSVSGCDMPASRMVHPRPTMPHTSQKYMRLSLIDDFGR